MKSIEEVGGIERSTGIPTVDDRTVQLQQKRRDSIAAEKAVKAEAEQKPQEAESAMAVAKAARTAAKVPERGISYRSNYDGQKLYTEVVDKETDRTIVRIPYGTASEAVEASREEQDGVDEVR